MYPAVNPLGLDARTRAVPISDIDYSSAFPGDINGGLEDYTAAKLIEDIKGASCCICVLYTSKVYPSDQVLDVDLEEWKLAEEEQIEGSTHEITKQIYLPKQ